MMLQDIKIKILILIVTTVPYFVICNSQTQKQFLSHDENSVELFTQLLDNLVYEKDSNIPFSGELVSKSKNDKVFINFKDGLRDGAFIRLNKIGDTIEYKKFNKGKELLSIEYTYENGKLVNRIKSEEVKGDEQDFEIFEKALDMIKNKEFDQLNKYLNPLWSGYLNTFKTCELLFGEFKEYNIKDVTKIYVEHQKSEHLSAKIDLIFRDTTFEVGFLIVEYSDKLVGEGFTFPSFKYDLKPDSLIIKIINDINDKNLDKIIKNTQFTEQHREILGKEIENIGQINDSFQFINFTLDLFPQTQLIKNYLIIEGDKKQVLSLIYLFKENGVIEFISFRFSPFRQPYIVLHKLN